MNFITLLLFIQILHGVNMLHLTFCSASSLSADESVIIFKDRKYYIWLLVDWNTLKIVAWHFSRYRDYSNAIKLLKQIKKHPQLITTDGLPVYKQAIEGLCGFKKFSNIPKYINGWVYIHNLFKDLGGDKYAIIQSLFSSIIQD